MRFVTKLCIRYIRRASVEEIDEILSHTFRRREELFPDYDPIYLALPKYDREERWKQLASFCDLAGHMYEKDTAKGLEKADPAEDRFVVTQNRKINENV